MGTLGRGEGIGVSPNRTCVVTVSYKGSADTAACLQSLGESNVPVSIVVVDTTPMDGELEAALSSCPSFTLLRAHENVGFGRGNNIGIKWALRNRECEYIFLLNNDAIIFPDSIEQLENAMTDNADVGILAPRIAYLDDPSMLWYGGGDIDWRRASAFTPGHNGDVQALLAMTERDVTFATGCALFIRRSAAEALGGFDPSFFMYEEDTELCLRAGEKGIRLRYIPKSLILHRVQGSSRGGGKVQDGFWSIESKNLPFYAFHVIRNRLLNAYLHAHGRQRIVVAVFFPLFLIRRGVPLLLGGRLDAIAGMFRGILDFWRSRPVNEHR
jgi:GT2 family glycosyltransferase